MDVSLSSSMKLYFYVLVLSFRCVEVITALMNILPEMSTRDAEERCDFLFSNMSH